ncbi:hypothetical protein BCR33DRAFT_734131 [Rhizoclosmatium globosum]|uniref:BHLH domain-containing protein n=1 Tax=Rhizoclosmatium globosum TaxID=329046 RepID=A0A1Y2CVI3_9FUNG|nr:hypothetical protein BCR33DRAFT_734131 [Rhizoclosmatium globosum]|eukprot:ORY50977.1 hypothetical protein BCR33DRAFT_734131 [Rhizoclosmatium globosum]
MRLRNSGRWNNCTKTPSNSLVQMSAITEEARKRQQQNEVERQRREVLNTGFARLAALVPSLHHKNTLPNSSTTSTSPVPAQVSPTSLPASKQMILTETVSHIQKLQAELESMSRALAAADSKCFSLVAELHRMSCVTGLQPNLDAIQESSSNVAPLSPISSPSSSNSENGEEQSRKRVRSQSPTHDSVHLPPLKRQNGDVASTSSNQSKSTMDSLRSHILQQQFTSTTCFFSFRIVTTCSRRRTDTSSHVVSICIANINTGVFASIVFRIYSVYCHSCIEFCGSR